MVTLSKEELLQEVKEYIAINGTKPNTYYNKKWNSAVRKYYKKWKNLLTEIEYVKPQPERLNKKVTDERIRTELLEWYKTDGNTNGKKYFKLYGMAFKLYGKGGLENIVKELNLNIKTQNNKPTTKEEAEKIFNDFVKENGFAPTVEYSRKLDQYARKNYGTWSNFVYSMGYDIHKNLYGTKRVNALDGHICDSKAEAILDNFLYKENIQHEKYIKYPNSNYNCDFIIKTKYNEEVWVEYYGLAGTTTRYDKRIQHKKHLAEANNLNHVEIYPRDLKCNRALEKINKAIHKHKHHRNINLKNYTQLLFF